jgi:hypothetical protein
MHSRAHHDNDPIYGAMRTFRMEREGEHLAGKCAQCHNPLSPDDTTTSAALQGVACGSCHAVTAVDTLDGKRGARALTFAETGVLRGPHVIAAAPVPEHSESGATEHPIDGNTVCMACHEAVSNSAGVATCTTGPENQSAGGAPCTSCHMPAREGSSGVASTRTSHPSHQFPGPHRAWYQDDLGVLANAVHLNGQFEDDALKVSLTNTTGHAFPSGFPGRMAMLLAVGSDASGNEVWRNFTDNPMAQSPESVFNKVYVDAEGSVTMPPYGVELKRDNRLEPQQTRQLSFELPDSVQSVSLKVIFRLAPVPVFSTLGIPEALESEPRVIETAVVRR